jgi:hypothetical protein
LFRVCSSEGEPIALAADFQRSYDSPDVNVRKMAIMWADIKRCFPGKEFNVVPARFMLTKQDDTIGEAFVAEYLIYQV